MLGVGSIINEIAYFLSNKFALCAFTGSGSTRYHDSKRLWCCMRRDLPTYTTKLNRQNKKPHDFPERGRDQNK